MTQFEEDIQFANDVIRIRDSMHMEILCSRQRVFWDYILSGNLKSFKIHGKCSARPMVFGKISTSGSAFSSTNIIISAGGISFFNSENPCITSTPEGDECIEIVDYDESMYFQHSLLYTRETLRGLVVVSELIKNSNIKNDHHNYFQIYWEAVPILTKLLRYTDNGII